MYARYLAAVAALFLCTVSGCDPLPVPPLAQPAAPPEPVVRAPKPWPGEDGQILWNRWTDEFWQQARERDQPVLLYLATPGGDGTFARGGVALEQLVQQEFAAVRGDPWHRPDLARRFGAGGWPTVALLLPDGRRFAGAVDVPPANIRMFLWRLRDGFEKRRKQIVESVERHQRDLPAPVLTLDVEAVFAAALAAHDRIDGGFGTAPKFPESSVLAFLLEYGYQRDQPRAVEIVHQALDRLLASPMMHNGGVAAFSHTPDWATPAGEFDAADQADLMQVLVRAAASDAGRFAAPARALVAFVERELYRPREHRFVGRRVAHPPAAGPGWWSDPATYADRNARLVSACLAAASLLADTAAAAMAIKVGEHLLAHCLSPAGGVRHLCGAEGELAGLLQDQALAALAFRDLHRATGDARFDEAARRAKGYMERHLYDRENHLFRETSAGMPGSYADGLLPSGNALAAALLLEVGEVDRARALLSGRRLRQRPTRRHATAALALLHADSTVRDPR